MKKVIFFLSLCLLSSSLSYAEKKCPTGDSILDMLKNTSTSGLDYYTGKNQERTLGNGDLITLDKAYDPKAPRNDGTGKTVYGGDISFGPVGKDAQSVALKPAKDTSTDSNKCTYDVTMKSDQRIVSIEVTYKGNQAEKNMPTYNICPTSIAKGVNQDAKAFTDQLVQLSTGKPVKWGNVMLSINDKANQDSLKGIMTESGKYSPTINFSSFKVAEGSSKDVACTYRYKRHGGKEYNVTFNVMPSQK